MKTDRDTDAEYAAIDREATDLAASLKRATQAHAQPILAALAQFQRKLAIIALCPHCSSHLLVEELSETAWRVHCPCGKVDAPFRGL